MTSSQVAGLCLSFLTSQSAVFLVVGHLPDTEGKVRWPDWSEEGVVFGQVVLLCLIMSFAGLAMFIVMVIKRFHIEEQTFA